jgi:hypothetical protein
VGAIVGAGGLGPAAIAGSNPARGIYVDISMPSRSTHKNPALLPLKGDLPKLITDMLSCCDSTKHG